MTSVVSQWSVKIALLSRVLCTVLYAKRRRPTKGHRLNRKTKIDNYEGLIHLIRTEGNLS